MDGEEKGGIRLSSGGARGSRVLCCAGEPALVLLSFAFACLRLAQTDSATEDSLRDSDAPLVHRNHNLALPLKRAQSMCHHLPFISLIGLHLTLWRCDSHSDGSLRTSHAYCCTNITHGAVTCSVPCFCQRHLRISTRFTGWSVGKVTRHLGKWASGQASLGPADRTGGPVPRCLCLGIRTRTRLGERGVTFKGVTRWDVR
jgi:hypothetical protein